VERAKAASERQVNDLLNSPELEKLRKAYRSFQKQEEAEDQAWWDSADHDDKTRAFRQVCRLMYQAEVKDKGSYRWAMYDVFGLDYGDGLNHYMELHNLIFQALDARQVLEDKKDDTEEYDISKDAP